MASFILCWFLLLLAYSGLASPIQESTTQTLSKRFVPFFPAEPPSCPICEADYANINSCADAAEVFANASMIIFNPGAFIDQIKCACTDTFQAAFPQCIDCFQQTDQKWAEEKAVDDPNDVVDGIRQVCAFASALLGNVSYTNGDATPTSEEDQATPTTNAARRQVAFFSSSSPAFIFTTLLSIMVAPLVLLVL